jgi:hypothetical protein
VKVDWDAPDDNFEAITSYSILFKNNLGNYVEELNGCDGTDPTVMTNTECYVEMLTLNANLLLPYASAIKVKVRATNVNGDGLYSEINTFGQLIEGPPAYMNAPMKDSASSTATVTALYWTALTLSS